jgi:hypothetical protein
MAISVQKFPIYSLPIVGIDTCLHWIDSPRPLGEGLGERINRRKANKNSPITSNWYWGDELMKLVI